MSTISQQPVTVMQFLSKLAFNKKYSLGFCKEHKSSVYVVCFNSQLNNVGTHSNLISSILYN